VALALVGAGCGGDEGLTPDDEQPSQKELANEIYKTCLKVGDKSQYECAKEDRELVRRGGAARTRESRRIGPGNEET
jgi:hypothetical protein